MTQPTQAQIEALKSVLEEIDLSKAPKLRAKIEAALTAAAQGRASVEIEQRIAAMISWETGCASYKGVQLARTAIYMIFNDPPETPPGSGPWVAAAIRKLKDVP